MAKQSTTPAAAPAASPADKYNVRRWRKPSERAKSYAQERKQKLHMHGKKEGQGLTDYEAGIRSGYLQAQSDHAGMFKYKNIQFYKMGDLRLFTGGVSCQCVDFRTEI